MKKHLLIILIWLWLTIALLAFFASRAQFWLFLGLESFILLVETSKLLFIIIVFPLLAGALTPEPEPSQLPYRRLLSGLKLFILFILLFLPLDVAGLALNPGALPGLAGINLLLLLSAVFSIFLSCRLSGRQVMFYYPAVFILYGAGPVLYYLVLELSRSAWSALVIINPFRLLWHMNTPEVFNRDWTIQCLIWAALIILAAIVKMKPPAEKPA